MEEFLEVVRYVNTGVYLLVAAAAFRGWREQGGASSAWVAAAFATLAFIGLQSLVIPDGAEGLLPQAVSKLTIVGVVFFPYALYRFTASLKGPPALVDRLATGAFLAVAVCALFFDPFPDGDETRTPAAVAVVLAIVLEFGGLLMTVAVRLWRAGARQPAVAGRRMRMLSAASIGITLALVLAAGQQDDSNVTGALVTQLLALGAVLFFFIGFSPPALVRIAWRRGDEEALREATERLVSATSTEEVIDNLLPHVTTILGARAAILLAPDGEIVGSVGEPPAAGWDTGVGEGAETQETVEPDLMRLEFEFGSLVIWASPYTPFFGQEEVELLRSLGVLTGLALDRTKLFHSEQEARAAAERANQRLQEANAGLTESRARLADAQSIAHIGSFDWDIREGSVSWSDEMFRIFGLKPGEVPVDFASYSAHVHEDDRAHVESVVSKGLEERRPYAFDHRIIRPDGEMRVVHARGQVEVDETGEPVRVVGTAQDVTASKEAERRTAAALSNERETRRSLEQLNAEMESFVYTVSHDLNSPIIAIQGFSEFLSKDFGEALPEKGRFYIERILVSAGYLQSLIKDLLSFSRIGRVQTEIENVSLKDIVDQATHEVRGSFPGLQVEARSLPSVHMNPLRARQLFTNLMQNSCRYSKRADTRVEIGSETVDEKRVQISVHDNGPGILKEHHSRVFGVFERLQESGPTEGSGMGLPICKKIVETAGGNMWIEESDVGLDVRFTLPLDSSAGETT